MSETRRFHTFTPITFSFHVGQAAEFRRLWGDKAELRRFKDGTVCEATVWGSNQDPWAVRRLVTRDMIRYLLAYQWGLEEMVYLADEVERTVDNLVREWSHSLLLLLLL